MAPSRKEAGSSGRLELGSLPPLTGPATAASKSGNGSSSIKKSGTSAVKSKSSKVSLDKVAKTPDKSKQPFRYRWMKKITPSNAEAAGREKKGADSLQGSKGNKSKASGNDKSAKTSRGSASPHKFEKLIDFNATADAAAKKSTAPPSTPRKFLFGTKPTHSKENDTQMKDAEGSDDEQYNSDRYESCEDEDDDSTEYTPRSATQGGWVPAVDENGDPIGPDHPSVPQSANNMEKARRKTKADVVDPNGRKHGRKLVHWHRVRMMEKILLMVQYECHRDNIVIPWDRIVHRLQPGSSGPSFIQHLNKMRDILVLEGHLIPPPLGKPNIPQDTTIRGLIRDFSSEDPTTTRMVGWNEVIEHRKESLQVEGIVRGSGNYARGEDGRRSTAGAARNKPRPKAKLPAEYIEGVEKIKNSVARESQKKRRDRARKAKRGIDVEESGQVPDPAELPSDDDYDPNATKKSRTSRRRSTRKSAAKPAARSEVEAASMMQFGRLDEATSKERSLPVKLVMSPENLAKFPAGTSGTPAPESLNQTIENSNTAEGDVSDEDDTDADIDDDQSDQEYEGYGNEEEDQYEETGEEEHAEDNAHQLVSPNTQIVNSIIGMPNVGYQGEEEHGTFVEWFDAVHSDIDPRVNGTNYKHSQGCNTTNAESDAFSRADSQAPDHLANRYAAAQAQFANANGFGAVMQRPFQTQLGPQLQSLGINTHDDPFVDRSVHTPPHASQPYDTAQQLAGDNTPPYHSFTSQTSNPQASMHMSSAHQYDYLPQDVHNGHFNGYTEINAASPYDNHMPNNVHATSSDSEYSHGGGDFINTAGRIYEDPQEHAHQHTHMMGFGDGWAVGNSSHTGGYMGFQESYEQHHFDERDENDHPRGYPSPGYVSYDDQASHQ